MRHDERGGKASDRWGGLDAIAALADDEAAETRYADQFTFGIDIDLDKLLGWLPVETSVEWFYSDSEATTDIPNRVVVVQQTDLDPATGEQIAEVADGTPADAIAACDAVEAAQAGWAATPPRCRRLWRCPRSTMPA